jgi:hypothetical protein
MTAVCGIACKVQLGTKKATVPTKPRPTGLLCFIYSATSVRHTAVKGFAVSRHQIFVVLAVFNCLQAGANIITHWSRRRDERTKLLQGHSGEASVGRCKCGNAWQV